MVTFINFEDIDILCSRSIGGNAHSEKSSRNSSDYTRNESEQKRDRWTDFKDKAKNFWNKAKCFGAEIISGLTIIKSFLKVSVGIRKEFARFRQARRNFA